MSTQQGICISIDPGVATGVSIMNVSRPQGKATTFKITEVSSMTQAAAQICILKLIATAHAHKAQGQDVPAFFLVFEDARLRDWYGREEAIIYAKIKKHIPITEKELNEYRGRLQGSGNVARSCQMWEEFCSLHGIRFHAFKPRAGSTKKDALTFKAITGYQGTTNKHGRDAGLLAWINRQVIAAKLFDL